MRCKNTSVILIIVTTSIMLSSISGSSFKINSLNSVKNENDYFYFVQITDTHVMNKQFDKYEEYKQNFMRALEEINSFKIKPAFVTITGDLVEWGGSDTTGASNYKTLMSCIYQKDDQLFADSGLTIPIYTTPGNHDYMWENSLKNYKNYIKSETRYIIELGDVSLFFIDSGSNYYLEPWDWARVLGTGLFDEDITWLEEKLGTSQSNKKIVLMHHPAVNDRDKLGVMVDVIARNRENFIYLCKKHNVDLVLAGHTHRSVVYDSDENTYETYPIYCNDHSTLFVQTDDCKQDVNYRNISICDGDIIVHDCINIDFKPVRKNNLLCKNNIILNSYILKNIILSKLYRRTPI